MGGMWRTPTGERLMGSMPRWGRAGVYAAVAVLLVAGSYLAIGRYLG
jgi:hypothetical protein